jgi:hypothetical protein
VAKVNSDREAAIDAVIGEAVGEGVKGMVAVAHAINNRAMSSKKTLGQVVSAPHQFAGYTNPGKSAKAAQKDPQTRAVAGAIIDGVVSGSIPDPTNGAVNFYSGDKKPGWANKMTKTAQIGGHSFFAKPDQAAKSAKSASAGPMTAAMAMLSPEAYGMASVSPSAPSNPSAGTQSAIDKNLSPVSYDMGPKRPNKPSQDVVDTVRSAVRDTLGTGYSVSVTSGQEDDGKQYGSNRHKTGLAVDVQIADPTGRVMNAVEDQKALMDVAQAAAAKGIKGIGFGTGYMGGVAMHLDKFTPGPDQDFEWGNIGNANAGLLAQARAFSLMPSSFYDKNLPASMPAPPSRTETPAAFAAAPVGKVERMALAPAAPRAPDPARFAYDVTPPSQPSGFGIVSAAQAASMPPDPMTTAKVGRLAPAVSMPARPTTPTPATALQAMNKPAFAPSMAVPTSAIAGLVSKAPTAPTQTFTPQPTTLMPPSVVAPPAPPAPVARVSAPVSRPSMPAAPRATAMDVYSGAAMQAMDNTGKNMVSRDALGNMSVTNQYGVTTTTSPSGFSSVSFGPKAPSAPSAPSAISGPLSQPGISTPSKGFLGIEPAKTETGNIARGVVGSAVGSAIGSTLGPIGSLIGAALGNSIAKGKNPFDALTGRQGLVSFNTPALGVINAFAPQTGGAFGTFPGKPTGTPGALGGKQSNNSMGGMRGISPGAAAAIGKGVGGLY